MGGGYNSTGNDKYISSNDKVVEATPPYNTILTLADPKSIHRTTTCDLYSNLLHHDTSRFPILSFNAHSLSNKTTHLKTLSFLMNSTNVPITETWCESSIFYRSLHVDNYVFFRADRYHVRSGM